MMSGVTAAFFDSGRRSTHPSHKEVGNPQHRGLVVLEVAVDALKDRTPDVRRVAFQFACRGPTASPGTP
jgi:hypothetical protein